MLVFASAPNHALDPDEILQDPKLEKRARQISVQLRCLVCQNQSIDDSDAPLAKDLRKLVRERLQSGDTDQQVLDFVVSRYGEFALLNPRFTLHTVLLWLSPILFLMLAVFIIWRGYQQQREQSAIANQTDLTPEEQQKLEQLLAEEK